MSYPENPLEREEMKRALLIAQETVKQAAADGNLDDIVTNGFHQALSALSMTGTYGDAPRRVTLTDYQLTVIASALLIQDARMKDPIITAWLFKQEQAEKPKAATPVNILEENDDEQ